MSTKFELNYCRCLYAHLQEPFKYAGSEKAKYDVTILIKKDDTISLEAIEEAIKADKLEKVGSIKDLLIDCDDDKELSQRDECKGCYKLTLKSNFKPKVYEYRTGDLTDKNAYSGEYIKCQGTVYEYSFARKKGISVNLKNVLLTGAGEELESTHPFESALSKPFQDPDLPF